MTSRAVRACSIVCSALISALLAAAGAQATPFTGPLSPYYLDNEIDQRIYVVQGTGVINSFPWAYSAGNAAIFNEANLAVTNVVTTNGFGSAAGSPDTAGQYTLGGTPTGVGHTAQPTPGYTAESTYDGTSDGLHNYTVQSSAVKDGQFTQNVIQTDLNWQSPVALFSVQFSAIASDWVGITYDPTNNSLWLSGSDLTIIADYSLSGTMLSSFNTGLSGMYALALDHADNTLWLSRGAGSTLEQWTKSGVMLQSGTPTGLPVCCYQAGDSPQFPNPVRWRSSASLWPGSA